MKVSYDRATTRRFFLRFLAGSPLLGYLGLPACSNRGSWNRSAMEDELISHPDEAINVFDFELAARETLPPAHYGYLATGVDDEMTLQANREGFSKIQIRSRRLTGIDQVDMATELFGVKWETPIILAPAGGQRAFHPEGEMATAKAAGARRHLMILSVTSTTSVEDAAAACGAPVWFQFKPTTNWQISEAQLKRAEAAACPVVVLTVDFGTTRNRTTLLRLAKRDSRECAVCHKPGFEGYVERRPMFDGLDVTGVKGFAVPTLTWDFVRQLKDHTGMKLVLKGIVTHEDARLCLEYGVDGIIVSNHGGRTEESGRATIDCLPEVLKAVDGRIPVLIDGGFRRGTDVFKALALGAKAICIGRPYLWGLAAFGETGVAQVLDILRKELELIMRQAGTASVEKIKRTYVLTN